MFDTLLKSKFYSKRSDKIPFSIRDLFGFLFLWVLLMDILQQVGD